MKKCKKVCLFTMGFVIINILLSWGYLKIMQESHLVKVDRQFNQIEKGHKVKFLILGNSHTFALQTQLMDNAINFGSYGETIEKTYYKLKYALENKGVRVENIIMNYDLGLLNDENINLDTHLFYWTDYADFTEFAQQKGDYLSCLFNWCKGKLFPYADGEVDAFDYFFAKQSEANTDSPVLRKINYVNINSSFHRQLSDDCLNKQLGKVGTYYFKKLLLLCKKYRVNIFFIRFPVTQSFFIQQAGCYDAEMYYGFLKKEYLSNFDNVSVLDFHSIYFGIDRNFRDPHHLSNDIRHEFTMKVNKQLNSLVRLTAKH